MNKICRVLIFVCATLPLSGLEAGAAGVFKWTDDQGVVHFGDQQGESQRAERIMLPRFPAPEPARQSAADDNRRDSGSTDGEAGEEALAQQQREIRAANCEIARKTLEHNQGIHRMYRLGPDGERQFLTDEEREALLKRSRDDVSRWCD